MKVRMHIEPAIRVEVGDLAELTSQAFVTNFWVAPNFYQFVRVPLDREAYLLLAEFDGGKRFYVVARMEGPDVEQATRALPERGVGEQ